MKIGLMLGDLFGSLMRRPATERYPFQRRAAPLRLRGPVQFDRTRCTGCGLCVMDCPADALALITLDKPNRRFVMDYHIDRCTFCAQCVESCNHQALWMSHTDWELAASTTAPMLRHYGEPEDVQHVLAEQSAASAPSHLAA
jgi:formate hydrogenlyase subunit 6/NADH:ubiquinone oxidoreductase subunit I